MTGLFRAPVSGGGVSATTRALPDTLATIPGIGHGWWSNPCVLPRADGFGDTVFLGGCDASGGLPVIYVDNASKTYARRTLARWEVDDHNVVAFAAAPDNRIIAGYARHSLDSVVRYHISESPNLPDFGPVQTLATSAVASYMQLFFAMGRLHMFYRVGDSGGGYWCWRRSSNGGLTWGAESRVTDAPYMFVKLVSDNTWFRIFCYQNPVSGTNPDIYYARMNSDYGDITIPGGTTIGNGLTNTPVTYTSMFQAVDIVDAATVSTRLMDVSGMATIRCLAVEFTRASTTDGKLYRYTYNSSSTKFTKSYICDVGVPFGPATQYHGGACFSAGNDGNTCYVARNNGAGEWYLDKYVTADAGASWTRTTLHTSNKPLARPALWGSNRVCVTEFDTYNFFYEFSGPKILVLPVGTV